MEENNFFISWFLEVEKKSLFPCRCVPAPQLSSILAEKQQQRNKEINRKSLYDGTVVVYVIFFARPNNWPDMQH